MKHGWMILWCVLGMVSAQAAEQGSDPAIAKVREVIKTLVPDEEPDSITATPMAGLYQVAYGARTFYLSADGRYLLSGDLYDTRTRTNLSERHRGKVRSDAIAALGERSMIVYPAKGTAKHTITVFTDIDCTFCRKLHAGMKEMNELGITVRYLAYPRAGVRSASYEKAVSVWCAADRNKAMDRAKNDDKVDKKTCDDNPVVEHLALGEMVGVSGTPAIVVENGTLLPGYLPPQRLLQTLEESKTVP